MSHSWQSALRSFGIGYTSAHTRESHAREPSGGPPVKVVPGPAWSFAFAVAAEPAAADRNGAGKIEWPKCPQRLRSRPFGMPEAPIEAGAQQAQRSDACDRKAQETRHAPPQGSRRPWRLLPVTVADLEHVPPSADGSSCAAAAASVARMKGR